MSQVPQSARVPESDIQSERSSRDVSMRRGSPTQNQQRSFFQIERSQRSDHIDRKHIQRRSPSSRSSSPDKDGRYESEIVTGRYQQNYVGGINGSAEAMSGSYSKNGSSFANVGSGERRRGRYRREVIRLPDQSQGQIRQVRRRMLTPEPDTLERIYIRRTGGEVIEEITEVPTTPPPHIQERTVVEPAGSPKVIKRVIRVPPKGGTYGYNQQQQQQQQQRGANFQFSDSTSSARSYSNTQPSSGGYQQQASTSYIDSYGGTTTPGNYGAVYGSYGATGGSHNFFGGNFPLQAPIIFTVDSNSNPSQPMPPIGCHPAFCFYI